LALPEATEKLSHGEASWDRTGLASITRGWVGIYLDVEVDWVEVEIMVERAYRQVAPKRLLRDQPRQA